MRRANSARALEKARSHVTLRPFCGQDIPRRALGRYMEVAIVNASHRFFLSSFLLITGTVGLFGCADTVTFSKDAQTKGLSLYNEGQYADSAGAFRNAVRQRPNDYQ